MGADDTKLRALYYPYSQCLNEDFLRRAVLMFDELVFLGPLGDTPPLDARDYYNQALGRHGKHLNFAWRKLRPEYEFLLERAAIRFIDIRAANTDILTAAWLNDLSDEQVGKICGGNTALGWLIPRARVPRDSNVWSQLPKSALGTSMSRYINNKDNWWGREQGEVELTRLPFAAASSLYINQCLLAAEQHSLIPVTDSITHHTLLLRKYERVKADVFAQNSQPNFAPFGLEQTAEEVQKYFILTMSILNNFLSEEELEKRTFKELLAYRDACKDEVSRFRVYVSKLAATLAAEPWTPQFQSQLNQIILSEIIPEMQRTCDGMWATYNDLFGGITKAVVPPSIAALTPTLTASFMAHLSLLQIVTLGATAFLSGIGLAVPQIVDSWKEYKNQRRNSLTFISEISNPQSLTVRVKAKRMLLFADESIINRQPPPESLFEPTKVDGKLSELEVRDQIINFLLNTLLFEKDIRTQRDAASFFIYLAHSDEDHQNGCEWLKQLATLKIDDRIIEGLIDSLQAKDCDIQEAVAMLMALWKPVRATDALIDYIRQENPAAVSWAMTALIRIGGRIVEQFLTSLLSESDEWRTSYAIDGLAILGATDAIPSLLSIAEDESLDNGERGSAALAAAILGSERGNELMQVCGYQWTLREHPNYKPSLPEGRRLLRSGVID